MGAEAKGLKNSPVISVRKMGPADVPAVLAILRESPEATIWSEGSLLKWCLDGNAWVAEADGRVAGILIARTAADELEILNLAVGTGDRRKGIASQVVSLSLNRAFAEGVSAAYLELRASNIPALAFYRKLGFQTRGCRADYYRDPAEDAILMVLHRPRH